MSFNKTFAIVSCAVLLLVGWVLYLNHIEAMSPPNKGDFKKLGDEITSRTDTLIKVCNSQLHIQKRILELHRNEKRLRDRVDSLERALVVTEEDVK